MSQPLEQLGRIVAEHQDEGGALDLDRGLHRFRGEVDRARLHRRRSTPLWFAAAALIAALAVFGWPDRPLDVDLAHGGDASHWIEGADEARFSDGSVVTAEPRSRWRIAERTPQGAKVQLERGALTARVVHRDDTAWQVDAGPFAIVVTGTAFSTTWDPATQIFALTMHEGTVVLSGPGVGGPLEVSAPEHVQVQLDRGPVVPSTRTTAAPAVSIDVPPPPAPPVTASTLAPVAPATSAQAPTTWRDHAQARRYPEALAALREAGPASVLATSPPADLLLVVQTARLGADAALAQQALTALQQSYPDSVQARTAQFLEGRMRFDRGQHAAAIAALTAYLQAAPAGAFAGEAQVLLILALHQSGHAEEARRRAQTYLQHHPKGPQAERLRSILKP